MFWRLCHSLTLLVVVATPAAPRDRDVSFVAAIKGSRYDQPQEGKPQLTRYFFFTEIFLTEGARVSEATLRRVGSDAPPWRFEPRNDVLTFAGGYFPSLDELDASFPDGRYQLDLKGARGALEAQPIEFSAVDGHRLPEPVTVTLVQDGTGVAPAAVDPAKELTITWSDYTYGRSDPNGVVDDLIFVILTDCRGKTASHSGRPFSGSTFLTYRDSSYPVGGEVLQPGQPYSIAVEHASVVGSDRDQGVPVFASYATVTYLDFSTTGDGSPGACPGRPTPEEK